MGNQLNSILHSAFIILHSPYPRRCDPFCGGSAPGRIRPSFDFVIIAGLLYGGGRFERAGLQLADLGFFRFGFRIALGVEHAGGGQTLLQRGFMSSSR